MFGEESLKEEKDPEWVELGMDLLIRYHQGIRHHMLAVLLLFSALPSAVWPCVKEAGFPPVVLCTWSHEVDSGGPGCYRRVCEAPHRGAKWLFSWEAQNGSVSPSDVGTVETKALYFSRVTIHESVSLVVR